MKNVFVSITTSHICFTKLHFEFCGGILVDRRRHWYTAWPFRVGMSIFVYGKEDFVVICYDGGGTYFVPPHNTHKQISSAIMSLISTWELLI